MKRKIVLAYSGGLDTSIILRWLIEQYNAEVIAYVADVGQGEDLKAARVKALKTGASKVYVEDLKKEFVKEFVFTSIKANAVYEGEYLLGTSLARPIIAKRQIEIAKKEKAFAVSHGATGKGNDQVRFELTFYALDPKIQVIAPWREWDMKSRTDLINYAKKHKIHVPYSCDRNIFHTSYEGGILEDPWAEPPESMFELSVSPQKAPDKPTYIDIEFKGGEPVKLGGKRFQPVELLSVLNKVAGKNGVGRVDIVENRYVGMKSRGVYETPGGTLLLSAHRAVESITLDREVMHLRDSLIPKFAELVYYGYWYTPEMEMIRAAIEQSQKNVNGTARLKIYKGSVIVVGRKSPNSLYSEELATFEEDTVYNQSDATGFIKLNALRLAVRELSKKNK
jgi:argininosuccinate synthase